MTKLKISISVIKSFAVAFATTALLVACGDNPSTVLPLEGTYYNETTSKSQVSPGIRSRVGRPNETIYNVYVSKTVVVIKDDIFHEYFIKEQTAGLPIQKKELTERTYKMTALENNRYELTLIEDSCGEVKPDREYTRFVTIKNGQITETEDTVIKQIQPAKAEALISQIETDKQDGKFKVQMPRSWTGLVCFL